MIAESTGTDPSQPPPEPVAHPRPTGSRPIELVVRTVAAISGALLIAVAFPPFHLAFLAPVGVAVTTGAWWRASRWTAVGTGVIAGIAFNLVLLRWISVLGIDAWLALSLVMGLWWILMALGVAAITWWRWWPVGVASMWVLQEALRGRVPWGGFPWGRLAFAQTDSTFTAWASLFGAAAVTAVTALVGALMLLVVRALRQQEWQGAVAGAIGAVAITVLGALIPLPTAGQGAPDRSTLAVVQGGVPRVGLDAMAQRRAVLNNHVNATLELAEQVAAGKQPAPAAVIWPENSSDVDPYVDPMAIAGINEAASAIGVPILVGAVLAAPTDGLWNVGIVWNPGFGPADFYIKQHPVPFGEYLPGRDILTRLISRFERVPKDFLPGDRPGVLMLNDVRIGDVICFEIAYDAVVRDVVRAGGRVLVVQTNNATYGGTAQPAQQVAMSQLRAVEHGRAVVIAATSGITAVVAPDGRIVAQLPEFVSDSLVVDVPLRDDLTLASRLTIWPEVLISVLALLGWVAGARERRRRIRSNA